MSGYDRLAETFNRSGKENLDDIKNGILCYLNDYRADEDITLVIIKRTG